MAYALIVDGDGNVYVTGDSHGLLTGSDIATIKYNSDGVEQWITRYDDNVGSDQVRAIGLDGEGNVYVTGTSFIGSTDSEYTTIKYNCDGVEQWVSRYNGPSNTFDWAYDLIVDGDGNIYVTGSSHAFLTDRDYATIKYNNDGVEQWIARYNGLNDGKDEASSIALDADGNVFVTGAADSDYATIKYNTNGVEQWITQYDGPDGLCDYARAIAVDGDGNVYVTGYILVLGAIPFFPAKKSINPGRFPVNQQRISYFGS